MKIYIIIYNVHIQVFGIDNTRCGRFLQFVFNKLVFSGTKYAGEISVHFYFLRVAYAAVKPRGLIAVHFSSPTVLLSVRGNFFRFFFRQFKHTSCLTMNMNEYRIVHGVYTLDVYKVHYTKKKKKKYN